MIMKCTVDKILHVWNIKTFFSIHLNIRLLGFYTCKYCGARKDDFPVMIVI